MVDDNTKKILESILYDMNQLKDAVDPKLAAYSRHWGRRIELILRPIETIEDLKNMEEILRKSERDRIIAFIEKDWIQNIQVDIETANSMKALTRELEAGEHWK